MPACAQLTTSTEVRLLPSPDRAAQATAAVRVEVVDHSFAATWEQEGPRLRATIRERRSCRAVTMVPMIRETKTVRTIDAGVYWEYGIAALTLGVASYAFVRPEAFSRPLINAEGEIVRERRSGYTSGGLFAAIGVYSLSAAIIDSVRARDSVTYEDTLERRPGGAVPCDPEEVPWRERSVALIVGAREVAGRTDDEGRVELLLPSASDPAEVGVRMPAAIRVDPTHAIAVEVVLAAEPDDGEAPTRSERR